jgi:hypothetical protein
MNNINNIDQNNELNYQYQHARYQKYKRMEYIKEKYGKLIVLDKIIRSSLILNSFIYKKWKNMRCINENELNNIPGIYRIRFFFTKNHLVPNIDMLLEKYTNEYTNEYIDGIPTENGTINARQKHTYVQLYKKYNSDEINSMAISYKSHVENNILDKSNSFINFYYGFDIRILIDFVYEPILIGDNNYYFSTSDIKRIKKQYDKITGHRGVKFLILIDYTKSLAKDMAKDINKNINN